MAKLFILSILALIPLATSSCGQEGGLSSKIKVNISPNTPKVFKIDTTANPGTELEAEVSGPYIRFNIQVVNSTGENIFLNPIVLTATGNKGGASVDGGTLEIGPEFFGKTSSPVSISAGGKITSKFEVFFGGLPKVADGTVDTNFFRIVGEIEGFTGTSESEPAENIEKTFQFVTKSN